MCITSWRKVTSRVSMHTSSPLQRKGNNNYTPSAQHREKGEQLTKLSMKGGISTTSEWAGRLQALGGSNRNRREKARCMGSHYREKKSKRRNTRQSKSQHRKWKKKFCSCCREGNMKGNRCAPFSGWRIFQENWCTQWKAERTNPTGITLLPSSPCMQPSCRVSGLVP